MAASFFFYDLETSGLNAHKARIMQFAGQRTSLDLGPIGEPFNISIKLTPDVVPEPDAILVTGITPQQTIQDGITEFEFLKLFQDEIATPETIFVGYNTIRFDDEFIRCLHYRNFFDPYEWQWQDGRSRWDLLDVIRMTRALRPDGIKWPVAEDGTPTNRLELITQLNGLDHENAHDALNDVLATIAVAKLIRDKQPKLFDFLLNLRGKREVEALVKSGQPFVYTSKNYLSEFEKTTVVSVICNHPKRQGVLVYDLRHDPSDYLQMTAEQLAERWRYKKDAEEPRLPVKLLQYNRCPAVAPLGVLASDEAAVSRLKIDLDAIKKHATLLKQQADLAEKLCQAVNLLDDELQARLLGEDRSADEQMYEGFAPDGDKQLLRSVRTTNPADITSANFRFTDKRLQALLPLYKARNFPSALSSEEQVEWEKFRLKKLLTGQQNSELGKFFTRLGELANDPGLDSNKRYLLEELQLYGETIMPAELDA